MPNTDGNPLPPAGIGITRLCVYSDDACDGQPGGSPHFHLLCTEMYVVLAGEGEVETLSARGVRRHLLSPGRLVWFEPGVVHRLINTSRDLDILVVMQNNGLPEAGDFVLAFPPDVLRDADAYRRHASLASGAYVYATDEAAAMARRDLAIRGYVHWKSEFESRGPEALAEMYQLGRALVSLRLDEWRKIVSNGPDAATARTHADWATLASGSIDHLLSGRAAELDPESNLRLGVCGRLGVYPFPSTP